MLDRDTPADQFKIPAVMLAMTLSTGSPRPILSHQGGVQSLPKFDALSDIPVASGAFEFGRPFPGVMAVRAVSRSVQITVRLGQSARRNLGTCHCLSGHEKDKKKNSRSRPLTLSGEAGRTHNAPTGTCGIGLGVRNYAARVFVLLNESENI